MALSVARSMVDSAANKAASEVMDELALLTGVRTEIWYIKDELRIMQAFLRTAEKMKDRDELVKVWAEQVEDLSYDIKYCLDEFKVNLGHPGCLQRLTKLRDRHQIAVQIRNLKVRVGEVSARIQRYSHLMKPITSSIMEDGRKFNKHEISSYLENIPFHSHSSVYESELVGFSRPMYELIDLMDIYTYDHVKVICVVGMGGVGKTTLARKIYETDYVMRFSCYAWITVSQSCSKIEILKDMIKQLFGSEALKEQLEGEVVPELYLAGYLRKELLEKRYFVVLDDLWNTDDWNWIKNKAFPTENIKGSRIIVTTRDVGLAMQCTSKSLVHFLKPLEREDAMRLLLIHARKTYTDMKNDENMRNMVTKIVDKSCGIPLAIVTIGRLLTTKRVSEWESIYTHLSSELECNPILDALRRMVIASYYHLPSHLKPCFLYLSIFPRDFKIQTKRLIDRWIAEGLVTSRVGMDIEDVAMSYIYELINRCMIQPSRVNAEGRIESCQVNAFISNIMDSISRDENFVYFTRDIVTSSPDENFRHVAHHGRKCPKISMDWSHVRSFTMFAVSPMEPAPSLCSAYLRMLNVLDLQDAQGSITQKDINNIGLLCRLKYLNVQGHSNISAFPGSIGKLHGLQYLDVRNSSITSLPTEISKLHNLSRLRCSNTKNDEAGPREGLAHTLCLSMLFTPFVASGFLAKSGGERVPRGIGELQELQILEVVDIRRTSIRAIKELGKLMQLRKLSVVTEGATKKKCKILCVAIEKLSSLSSLRVDAGRSSLEWLRSVSSPPSLLSTLKLVGFLGEMPDCIGSLMHLVKIYLAGSELRGGKTMELLGKLPNLMLLVLYQNAYAGEKLVFAVGAFKRLTKLDFYDSSGVRQVRFEEGTTPHLEKMEFGLCRLESGIIGIRHLPRIAEISLGRCGQVARLRALQNEVDAHPNHPMLRLSEDERDHDLGYIVEESSSSGEDSSPLPELAAVGESSSQVVVMTARSDSQDRVQGDLDDDDFCSCDSDDDDVDA